MYVAVSAEAIWHGGSVDGLVRAVGLSLGAAACPDSVEALADCLCAVLQDQDVVLQVDRVQQFDGSLPGVVQRFWQPLVSALRGPLPRRLTGIMTLEYEDGGKWDPAWDAFTQAPRDEDRDASDFDPAMVVRLQPLAQYHQRDLIRWMRERWQIPQHEAGPMAEALMRRTGGDPLRLHAELKRTPLARR